MTFNFFFYVSLCLFCVFHFFPFGPENLCRYQIPQTFLFNENINLKLSVRSKNCSIFHQNKSKITSNIRKTVALWDISFYQTSHAQSLHVPFQTSLIHCEKQASLWFELSHTCGENVEKC